MSRQVRHRVAALVLGGLLLGAPLLTTGPANAAEPSPTPAVTPAMPPSQTKTKIKISQGTGGSAPTHAGKSPRSRKAGERRVPTWILIPDGVGGRRTGPATLASRPIRCRRTG